MYNWLFKPFPFIETRRQAVLINLLVGAFVTVFLYVFQPFGIDIMPAPLLVSAGYGLIAMCSGYFSRMLLPVIMPGVFNPQKWNVLKNILFIGWILLLIAIFNWLYALAGYGLNNLSVAQLAAIPSGLLENLGITFAVGIFPVLMVNYIQERQLFKKNTRLAREVADTLAGTPGQAGSSRTFTLPHAKGRSVTVSSKDLILVKAEGGNYVTVYWWAKNELQSQLWRTTLKGLMEVIGADPDILQCHKSYLINRSFISRVSGNARNLVLHLEHIGFEVPVSRSFPRELVGHYRSR